MPNRNYDRGAQAERYVQKDLESRGWFTIRAAGSKGPADVVAIKRRETGPFVELIQVKIANAPFTPKERRALLEAADKAGALALWARVEGYTRPPEYTIVME